MTCDEGNLAIEKIAHLIKYYENYNRCFLNKKYKNKQLLHKDKAFTTQKGEKNLFDKII